MESRSVYTLMNNVILYFVSLFPNLHVVTFGKPFYELLTIRSCFDGVRRVLKVT